MVRRPYKYAPPVRRKKVIGGWQNPDGTLQTKWLFYTWLKERKKEQNYLGTLARVFSWQEEDDKRHGRGNRLPADAADYKTWKAYLVSTEAQPSAFRYLDMAWVQYQNHLLACQVPDPIFERVKIRG